MRLKRTILVLAFSLLLCTAYFTVSSYAATNLQLVLYTTKPSYWLGDYVPTYGYLFANQTLVPDGIINIEVDAPITQWSNGNPVLFRTANTGSNPSAPQTLTTTSLYCSDQFGAPKSNIKRGTIGYFTVEIYNNNDTTVNSYYLTLTVLNIANGVVDSIYFAAANLLLPHQSITITMPFSVQATVPLGTATVYANIFTQLPKDGGYAIALERNATFSITSTALSAGQTSPANLTPDSSIQTSGSWLINFSIPRYQYAGNYSIFTTSRYANTLATAQKTVEVRVPDVNNDGKVNVLDLISIASKLGWTGTPGAIAQDVNRDGAVNVLDLIKAAQYIGWQTP